MFLDRILIAKRAEVVDRERAVPLARIKQLASRHIPARDFGGALRGPGLSVIAEVKRASPSKGVIADSLDPVQLAKKYVAGGCAAISVLTDRQFFGAQPDDLQLVSASVPVPILRKDFLIDEYQIWESRAMGSDAVLLIVAALEPASLHRMIKLSGEVGMFPLVEVHDEEELQVALDCGARQIGVNNRDLRSFRVDLDTTRRLAELVPPDVVLVSESGISCAGDAALVASSGADAILVGEALVTSADPARLIAGLRSAGDAVRAQQGPRRVCSHPLEGTR